MSGSCQFNNEVSMRILQWIIVGVGMFLAVAPAAAQTYDPTFPVCLQVYDRDAGHIACVDTSLAQCAMSASGTRFWAVFLIRQSHHYRQLCGLTPIERRSQRTF